MTKKTAGWEARLISYLRSIATSPFRPGSLDCGLFFGGAYKAMTGIDIDDWLRGNYRTIEQAYELLNSRGHTDHVEYVASLLEEVPPLFARRGDGMVVTDMHGNPALGVVQGENIYVMGLNGLGLEKLTTGIRAFRV